MLKYEVGDSEYYKQYLHRHLGDEFATLKQYTVEKKADSLYKTVSAGKYTRYIHIYITSSLHTSHHILHIYTCAKACDVQSALLYVICYIL